MIPKIRAELEKLQARGGLRGFSAVSARKPGFITYHGREVLDLTSWDFLGLGVHPKVKRAAQVEIEQDGLGARAPRLVSGTGAAHILCEQRLCQFLGQEAAILFSSKNQAVLSLVTALTDELDTVFVDEQLQSPVMDAAYLVNAQTAAYEAGSLLSLETMLKGSQKSGNRLIFIEMLSPISGKLCDLPALLALSERYDAYLVIDESCALGTVGLRGAGSCEQLLLGPRVLCRYGDLSLGLAGYGGFVAGARTVVDYLVNRSRTFGCEVAPPSAWCAATAQALDLVELMTGARERLRRLAALVHRGLEGMRVLGEGDLDTPIACVPFGNMRLALEVKEALFARGFCAEALGGMKARNEGAVLRMLVNLAHTEDKLGELLNTLGEIMARLASLK